MQKEIQETIQVLKKGGLILYPTDTVWGIGCDATNYEAVDRIYQSKQRDDKKTMICLVSDFKMLQHYVEYVPLVAYNILKYSLKPTTIIYDKPKHIAANLVAKDNTLAIRVVRDGFCNEVVKKFGKPIVSTSANLNQRETPLCFDDIDNKIRNEVDYIVNLNKKKKSNKSSTIIRLKTNGIVEIIRK